MTQIFNRVLVVSLVLLTFAEFNAQERTSVRENLLMDFNWKFALGHAANPKEDFGYSTAYFTYLAKAGYGDGAASANFDDRAWRVLNLPHDWCVELDFDPNGGHSHGYKKIGHNFPENSVGWYRKNFFISADDLGKKISIRFDGVHRNSIVWVNGFYLGTENSGYTSFSYDVTDYLNYDGNNVVAVRVDASIEEGWFYEGAGIYRHVWLTKTSPLHVAEYGTFITTELKNNQAVLTARTLIENESDSEKVFDVIEKILNEDGSTISEVVKHNFILEQGEGKEYFTKHHVDNPELWALEKPYLHKLVTTIKEGSKIIDEYKTTFGIRTVRFDADSGFFLNEQNIKILGTNDHQDHAGLGTALPDAVQEFRVKRLKDMGSNAIRTSHNPPTPELLDACDKLGMLVLDENRLMGINDEHLRCLERLIKRDRNHPSVIIWSLGNEEWAIEGNDFGKRITKTMQDYAQRLDSSRAFTVASSGGWDTGSSTVSEVFGINYISHGDVEGHHKIFPWQPAIGTEETTASGTRGIYITDPEKAYQAPSSFASEAGSIERGWKFYYERPYLAGLFYWTGFDYRGEPNPYGWPQVTSQFGILDLCGFPKDHFYYLKSWWGNKPVLYMSPHWNWPDRIGEEIDVTINSNLDKVELFLNNKSLGIKEVELNTQQSWKVKYERGSLVAVGYKFDKEVIRSERKTTGEAAAIDLIADRKIISADGEDVSIITIQVNDENGLNVPTANNEIFFSVEGKGSIIGVGNGNPSSHEADKFMKTIKVSVIENLKELSVESLKDRKEVLKGFDSSNWFDAFSREPKDWRIYKDSLIIIRGEFMLPEFEKDCEINLFTKSIVENQSIYVNGVLIDSDIIRDDPNQSYKLDHSILNAGRNEYAITGKRFRLRYKYDEPNRDPGLIQIIYPAKKWKRKVFNGLAQVILQSSKQEGEIILRAESEGLKEKEIKISTKQTELRPFVSGK